MSLSTEAKAKILAEFGRGETIQVQLKFKLPC